MEHRPVETKHAAPPPTPEALEAAALAAATKYQEGTHALEAVQQVRKAVGEPFRVLEINVHTTSVSVQVQNPKKKENVDEYDVDAGKLEGPTPVRLIGTDTDEAAVIRSVFDPSEVALDKIAAVVHDAEQKVQLEGRDEALVTIRRDDESRKVEISVLYNGSRKNASYTTDRNGQHGKAEIH
jgi:hypothetical protein